jgi:hypothetical protein
MMEREGGRERREGRREGGREREERGEERDRVCTCTYSNTTQFPHIFNIHTSSSLSRSSFASAAI